MRCSPRDPVWSLRLQLAREIARALGPGAQHTIGPSYGIPQPRMSELERGIVDRCSVEWLIRRIHRMGGSVDITVKLGDVKRAWHRERFARMRARRKESSAG
ncbi:MAG TPA: XRE family transcriptional regulator [Gemmatimonadaceae bacterium]|nr:XRE family transcriptional regulator [Gemmatimonadaceae bacterium]